MLAMVIVLLAMVIVLLARLQVVNRDFLLYTVLYLMPYKWLIISSLANRFSHSVDASRLDS